MQEYRVWNGLTNEYHPTQMLADMLTIRENFGELKGRKLVYMGDARFNMGNSLMIACSKLGMHFVACTTKEYFPNEELVETCKGYAAQSGATITLTEDVKEGKLMPEEVNEACIERYLDTHDIPDPDLLIRTSGEQRLSNYLLWQLAYTEFYFTDVPWPDFSKQELEKAIEQYNRRDRRYGGVKEE